MELIILLFLLLVQALLCMYAARVIASRRGLAESTAVLHALLLGPLGVWITAASPVNWEALDNERVRVGEARRCLACRTVVEREATRCRSCREELPPPRARR